jgi:hypothetical protein
VSASITAQLGGNSGVAIHNGALANKPQFFGTSTSEITADAATYGGWNGDFSWTVYPAAPWAVRGGASEVGAYSGLLTFMRNDSRAFGFDITISHRTILSGY